MDSKLPTTMDISSPSPSGQFPTTHFPFFSFPSEIRNLIYAWAFILSRRLSLEYNVPDFIVHGDEKVGSPRGGLRWDNVEKFPLLLTCKTVFKEALPIISAEAYMEIKCYADRSLKRREKKAFAVYSTLLRTKELCGNIRKLVVNVTPTLWDMNFEHDVVQVPRLAGVIKGYERLRELTLIVRPSIMSPVNWDILEDFFLLADKRGRGVSLCLELVDDAIDEETEEHEVEAVEEIMQERVTAERIIEEMTVKLCGKGAEVWVEWNLTEDPGDYC